MPYGQRFYHPIYEAADLQLRDIDLDREYVTVRTGEGGPARRVPLEGIGTLRRLRDDMALRFPDGLLAIRSCSEGVLSYRGSHSSVVYNESTISAQRDQLSSTNCIIGGLDNLYCGCYDMQTPNHGGLPGSIRATRTNHPCPMIFLPRHRAQHRI